MKLQESRLACFYTFDFFSLLVGKLMEMHGESGTITTTTDETGAKIERDSFEPPVQESV